MTYSQIYLWTFFVGQSYALYCLSVSIKLDRKLGLPMPLSGNVDFVAHSLSESGSRREFGIGSEMLESFWIESAYLFTHQMLAPVCSRPLFNEFNTESTRLSVAEISSCLNMSL